MSVTTIILIVVAVGIMVLMHTVGHGGQGSRGGHEHGDGPDGADRIGDGDGESGDVANVKAEEPTESGHAHSSGHRRHGCC